VPDRLERVVAATEDGDGRQRADHLEEQRDLLVARAVDTARTHDDPLTVEVAHDLLAGALRLVVRGRPAVAAERRDEDQLPNAGALSLTDDVSCPPHVHAIERGIGG
jgi:hypothetical protein